jgi:hypothetical protein
MSQQEVDTVNCMFRLFFDALDKNSKNAVVSSCLSVSPISIDVSNKCKQTPSLIAYSLIFSWLDMSTLNCVGLCSFVWSFSSMERNKEITTYHTAIFDLGRWYAEEMPKQAMISDLRTRRSSFLANSNLCITSFKQPTLLSAKVCTNDTKKYIWALNEEVTSYVAATSFCK